MQMLKDAILERGKALNQDVLLVDSFLNHQVDVALMEKSARNLQSISPIEALRAW